MIRARTTLLTLGLLFATSAGNAETVDLKKSRFTWTATKKVGSAHTGQISLKSANIVRTDGKLERAEFVMDMNSMTVTDLEGDRAGKFLKHIKNEDFFEVEKFPLATLLLTEQVDNDTVSGTLTIKDQTQPISIDFVKSGADRYVGTMTFDRTKFGIIYGSQSFFKKLLGNRIINNEVQLQFEVVLNK